MSKHKFSDSYPHATLGSTSDLRGRETLHNKLDNLVDKLEEFVNVNEFVNVENIKKFHSEATNAIMYLQKLVKPKQEILDEPNKNVGIDISKVSREVRLYKAAIRILEDFKQWNEQNIQENLDFASIKEKLKKRGDHAKGYSIALEALVDHKTGQLYATSEILKSYFDQPGKILRIASIQANPENIINNPDVANEALKDLQKKLKSNKYLLKEAGYEGDRDDIESLKGEIDNSKDPENDIDNFNRRVTSYFDTIQILEKFQASSQHMKDAKYQEIMQKSKEEADRAGTYTLTLNALMRQDIVQQANPYQQFYDALLTIGDYKSISDKEKEDPKYQEEKAAKYQEIMQNYKKEKEADKTGSYTLALNALVKQKMVQLAEPCQQSHDTTLTKLFPLLAPDSPTQKIFKEKILLPLVKQAIHYKEEYLHYHKHDYLDDYLYDPSYDYQRKDNYKNLALDDPNRKHESETKLRATMKEIQTALDNLEQGVKKFQIVPENLDLFLERNPQIDYNPAQAKVENIINLDEAAKEALKHLEKKLKGNRYLLKEAGFDGDIDEGINNNFKSHKSLEDGTNNDKRQVIPQEENIKDVMILYDEAIRSLKEPTKSQEENNFLLQKPDHIAHYQEMVLLYDGALQILTKFQQLSKKEKENQHNYIMDMAAQGTYKARKYIFAANALGAYEKKSQEAECRYEELQASEGDQLTEDNLKRWETKQRETGPDMDHWLKNLTDNEVESIRKNISVLRKLLHDPSRSKEEKLALLPDPSKFIDLLSTDSIKAILNTDRETLNEDIAILKNLSSDQHQANGVKQSNLPPITEVSEGS